MLPYCSNSFWNQWHLVQQVGGRACFARAGSHQQCQRVRLSTKHSPCALNIALVLSAADSYEHVASILPNVTRVSAGRQLLLQPGRGLLQALTSQVISMPAAQYGMLSHAHRFVCLQENSSSRLTRCFTISAGHPLVLSLKLRSKSKLRRRGCAGAIKNCCFSCEQDGTANAIAADTEVRVCHLPAPINASTLYVCICMFLFFPKRVVLSTGALQALSTILDVLCSITAKVADEPEREALAEAVLCLARDDSARKQLWKCSAPMLLQKG